MIFEEFSATGPAIARNGRRIGAHLQSARALRNRSNYVAIRGSPQSGTPDRVIATGAHAPSRLLPWCWGIVPPEAFHDALALLLHQVAMNFAGLDARPEKPFGELAGAVLGVAKDDRELGRFRAENELQ